MFCFSSLLQTTSTYKPAADRLFAALDLYRIEYTFINQTKDIWLRDFMPVKSKSGAYISFRYEPSYLKAYPQLRTDYRREVAEQFSFPVTYSTINLDGGNVVFSPSKAKALLSDRVFAENSSYAKDALVRELERLLEAQVILIPSLKSDMTGHADGMVRFVDENTAIGNRVPAKNGLEQRIRADLSEHGINTVDFPYYSSPKGSAAGCYLNFLETERHILLPVFGHPMDRDAVREATRLFSKAIVPVDIHEIAAEGGGLHCISWESM